MKNYNKAELYHLRTNLPIKFVIEDFLKLPCKMIEGIFRFQCPNCYELACTAINPKTNLCRCFNCKINYNPIDIVMKDKSISFVEAVKALKSCRY